MEAKDKLINYVNSLSDEECKKFEKFMLEETDKNKEMSDFLFDMINGSTMKFTGEKEVTYYKNEEWVIQQDYKNDYLWIRYSLIWRVFEEKFKLNNNQIKEFISIWVETNTEWRGLTPTRGK